jgi:cell division protein FtsI/penicillin-binding protein 2
VLLEPGTGEIRAMAQSRDYGPEEWAFVNGASLTDGP